jgi:hypothetical protein
MWFAQKVVIQTNNFSLANFCIKRMATNERLSRLENNAITAEEMVKKLKFEVIK